MIVYMQSVPVRNRDQCEEACMMIIGMGHVPVSVHRFPEIGDQPLHRLNPSLNFLVVEVAGVVTPNTKYRIGPPWCAEE